MKTIFITFKNLIYTAMKRTLFFSLLCIGQIISICVVIAAVGVFELWMAEKDFVTDENGSVFWVSLENKEVQLSECKKIMTELKEWLGEDFREISINGYVENNGEYEWVHGYMPGSNEYVDNDSNDGFTYNQLQSDEKVILIPLSIYGYDVKDEKYYDYAGIKYKIVGRCNYNSPLIPIYAMPDEVKVQTVQLRVLGIMSKQRVNEIISKIHKYFGTDVYIDNEKGIDLIKLQSKNTIYYGMIMIIVILMLNSVVCYYYLFGLRKNWMVVSRINGCSVLNILKICLMEIFIEVAGCAFIGIGIFNKIIYPIMLKSNGFYREIYGVKEYVIAVSAFMIISVIMIGASIISTNTKSIVELKKN